MFQSTRIYYSVCNLARLTYRVIILQVSMYYTTNHTYTYSQGYSFN